MYTKAKHHFFLKLHYYFQTIRTLRGSIGLARGGTFFGRFVKGHRSPARPLSCAALPSISHHFRRFTSEMASKQDQAEGEIGDLVDQIKGLDIQENEITNIDVPPSLRKVASLIADAERIIVLSGAGVSCSAGIPDFRTPGTGLYDNLELYNLPYPEAVFDVDFYQKDPQPFCSLAKEIWPGLKYSPTLTHSFLKLLSKKNKLLRNYSQNIDGLEFLAEIPSEQIIECHGHFRTASCIKCGNPMDGDECKRIILETDETPKCGKKKCGGHVKPDIVFFGEGLPRRFHSLLKTDLAKADLLIVIGTSLMVGPVNGIPRMVKCKRVLLNRELVGDFKEDSDQDIFYGGDCDDSVITLAKVLGWDEELRILNKKTKIKVTTAGK